MVRKTRCKGLIEGVGVRRCGDEIVTEGAVGLGGFDIIEEVAREAVVIKVFGIGGTLRRDIFSEGGVEAGQQGGQ